MNTAQAKQLSLPDLMSRLGYEPVKVLKGGQELWYLSPFRQEKDPSFVTDYLGGKWIWKDFGDTGGTVVDFVMRHENYTRISDALSFLSGLFQGHLFETITSNRVGAVGKGKIEPQNDLFSFRQQNGDFFSGGAEDRSLEFLEAHAIANPAIHNYLEKERAIPVSIVDLYLVEVKYRNKVNGKDYFAFGIRNECGGYEIRAASSQYSFKSALNGRDVTLIRGTASDHSKVSVFEGMVDFLSLLVMLGAKSLSGDAIIMHSLSSFQRTLEVIRRENYQNVNTFLDNDRSGQEATLKFSSELGTLHSNQSEMFSRYKDLNEALCANNNHP